MEEEEEEEPYDEAEENRLKRQQIASQPKYAFHNFSMLRSSDDYAKGYLLNKGAVRNQHLVHQTNKIPKSICQLPRDLNKIAINLHTNLLGMCPCVLCVCVSMCLYVRVCLCVYRCMCDPKQTFIQVDFQRIFLYTGILVLSHVIWGALDMQL